MASDTSDSKTNGQALDREWQTSNGIAAVRTDRRSFLTRAIGQAGTVALLAVSFGACSSGGSDPTCDSDRSDNDPFDAPGSGGDTRCDSD